MAGNSAPKTKTTSNKLKAQTSKIVSSFKTPTMTCSMQREYFGHRDGVWEVSVGRAGQIIATASADHSARVWAMDSGRCLLQYIGLFFFKLVLHILIYFISIYKLHINKFPLVLVWQLSDCGFCH